MKESPVWMGLKIHFIMMSVSISCTNTCVKVLKVPHETPGLVAGARARASLLTHQKIINSSVGELQYAMIVIRGRLKKTLTKVFISLPP